MIKNWFLNYINKKKADPSPLAVFRIGFGLMMAISIIRFWSYGWIELLYLNPKFHFKYFGFEWVKVYGDITYLIFLLCLISAIFVALGYRYKLSIITFFLTFTYIAVFALLPLFSGSQHVFWLDFGLTLVLESEKSMRDENRCFGSRILWGYLMRKAVRLACMIIYLLALRWTGF